MRDNVETCRCIKAECGHLNYMCITCKKKHRILDDDELAMEVITSAAQRLGMEPLELATALQGGEYVIVPRKPDANQNLMGARSIGRTMRWPNHIDRAKDCWDVMVNALFGSEIPAPKGDEAALSRLPQKAGGSSENNLT